MLPRMIWAPVRRTSAALRPRTTPWVPTGMKAGVGTVPWGRVRVPARERNRPAVAARTRRSGKLDAAPSTRSIWRRCTRSCARHQLEQVAQALGAALAVDHLARRSAGVSGARAPDWPRRPRSCASATPRRPRRSGSARPRDPDRSPGWAGRSSLRISRVRTRGSSRSRPGAGRWPTDHFPGASGRRRTRPRGLAVRARARA